MFRMGCRAALSVTVGLIASILHAGPVLYVDDDASPGGDGLSWGTACRFLQDALADAAGLGGAVSEVRVAQGVYRPDQDEAGDVAPGDREATFRLCNGVALLGGYAGIGSPDPDERDVGLYATILSGDLADDDGPDFAGNEENSFHVVTGSGTDGSAVIDGFTIRGGNANGPYGAPTGSGGGFFNENGSPTLSRCTFSGNAAAFSGGGMHNGNSNPSVSCCTFSGNWVIVSGGAMGNFTSSPTVVNCVFLGNETILDDPGRMSMIAGQPAVTARAAIRGTALRGGGGGAIFNDYASSPTVAYCTFRSNRADFGGAIYNWGGLAVANCVFWANSPEQVLDDGNAATVRYSDVQGGWSGAGSHNIDADPLFIDPDNGDLRLSAGSPCIDAGDNAAVPEDITVDLDGNPRFVDDPGTPDCQQAPGECGDPPVVDMGAYELQALPPCPWDLDGDGAIGISDLLQLLGSFGPCPGCPADFDGDGLVGILDFLALLQNFGPCSGSGCPWDVNGDGVVDQADLHAVLDNLGPCADPDNCPWDVNGDGVVDFEDVVAVLIHFGPCPAPR
jgi:hypothetical protein